MISKIGFFGGLVEFDKVCEMYLNDPNDIFNSLVNDLVNQKVFNSYSNYKFEVNSKNLITVYKNCPNIIPDRLFLAECLSRDDASTTKFWKYEYTFRTIKELNAKDFVVKCEATKDGPKQFIFKNAKKIH